MAPTLDTIEFQLHLLFEHETVNGFLRDYYRLVHEELVKDESRDDALCGLFSEFLDLEIHHHQSLEHAGREGPQHGEDLTPTTSEAKQALIDLLARVVAHERDPRTAQELIAAECEYYLRRVPSVISHMQEAIDAGCRSPIVYFSLGYNQFEVAVQPLMVSGEGSGGMDQATFEAVVSSCTEAAWSFGRGLRDEPFDAQIYYWIGFIAETLGAWERALDAYRRAVKSDPGFAPVCAEKEQMLSGDSSELRLPPPALHALRAFERNIAQIIG